MNYQYIIISVVFLLLTVSCNEQKKSKYVSYETLEKSKVYKIAVNGDSVFVAKEFCYGDKIFHTSQFTTNGNTEISIQLNEPIEAFKIRPEYLNIRGAVSDNELRFSVSKPEKLLIEVNNNEPLCLFLTPPETDVPNPEAENVLYFNRGTHEVGVINPKDNQTIYLEEGALVKGRIFADNTKNVTIKGRGIIDARGYTSKEEAVCGIEFRNSEHIKIEGIGIRSGIWWQTLFLLCNDVEVSHLNLMSFGENNDGIDIDGVTNFKVSNCFIGCGDDGFGWHALSAETNGEPDTKNCLAEDCVILNAYAGNGIRIGASMETNLFSDITFRNIAILDHINAGIRSDHSDWALVRNLRFENFHIDKPDRPIEIKIEKTGYSNKTGFRDERGHIQGLYFENINSTGGDIVLSGYDSNHKIQDVWFKNCFNAGVKIKGKEDINLNEFVENISFE